ncbi:MAG: hypothetical protein HY841_07095 [Bacteroidetes bacterium]|nr:hypothetical protein [Bacteroidota bacterium]
MDKETTNSFLNTIYKASITLPYDYLKIYINAMSSNIEKDLTSYEAKLEEQRKNEGFFSTFMKSVVHEINKVSIPKYFYNATFIFIYSKFEGDFKTICEAYQQQKGFKLSVSDLGGQNYIQRGKTYLEKCFGIDMHSLNTEWEGLTKYQKVRNAIVHNNSSIIAEKNRPMNEQKLFPIVSTNASFSLDDNGDFHIKDKLYLLNFCDISKTYIEKTLELMDK